MTKINRITVNKFKSFANKVDIPFNHEFNCILGPNGSGKSNIGDAICFVLGRISAKSLRAEKASNLIFNGGKKGKPASFGSVEIAFCNKNKVFPEPEEEIVINRTITKNGNSTYRINSKRKTRSEVVDFLANARINPQGYNIILQGDINRFVTMSSLERRKIIEEISDVSIYEEKKHKAILELNKVEEKLNSAEIILKERKTYLKELKKDRDQALKFKELKDRIDSNKATYLNLQIKERTEVKSRFNQEIAQHQNKVNEAEKKVAELKNKINQHKEEISNLNKQIEQKGEKGQLQVHREIENFKIDLTKDKARISTLKDEINKIQQRKDQFKQEIKELEQKSSSYSRQQKELHDQIIRKNKELEHLHLKMDEFKKKHKIESSQGLEQEIEQKDQIIEEKQEKIQQIRLQQQELLREKDRREYQIQTTEEKVKKVREVAQQNKEQLKQLQDFKNDFKRATLRLNQILDQDSSFASQLAHARSSLNELHEQQAKLNAKTRSYQAGLAQNQSIKSILDHQKQFRGVFNTIAELGQVNKKYALALETAAGTKMRHLVVDTDQTAAECIEYLKKNKLGPAAFIPLNKIRASDIIAEDKKLSKLPGVHDFALNLVSFKPQFKNAFTYVFSNSLVVENVETARSVGIGRIKMTTLDGSSVEASGVMRGGYISHNSSLGFKEKDSLQELEKVETKIAEMEEVLTNISDKRSANDLEISSLRNKKAELEAEIIKLEKILHLGTDDLDASLNSKKELSNQLKEVEEKLNQISKEITLVNKELANLKVEKNNLRSKVNQLRDPRLLAQLSAFEETRQKTREELLRAESDLKNSHSQMEQIINPERSKINEILKQHEKEEIQFKEEIKQLTLIITEKEKTLILKEKESQDFYAKYKELFNQREKLNSAINQAETEIEQIRDRTRNTERELNLTSLKNAEVKAKLAGLEEEFNRFKSVPLLKNKTIEEVKPEIDRFEIMLSQMSTVNLKALEVYEHVETEYNKLVGKKEDLSKEKTDVLTFMNEIETKKKEHFLQTFNEANKNFERIFSSLFNKGRAYLELENSENPFEEGLNIKVKLTNNRFLDIKSLSGGEKTITALAFIFSIQEYQPASFYILDEIDAALDKHNAERLAKLIRNYSTKAQYVVISHNDALISEADTLYGVSMKEGISKVTSLKI